MNRKTHPNLPAKWLLSSLLLLLPIVANALSPEDIKDYGDVFRISAKATSREQIEVRWDITDGYYLYHNKFLKFRTETPGVVLSEPQVPDGERKFDDLLGEEVIKFHGSVTVVLPIDSAPPGLEMISLKMRSQGCMEDVFCYPPTEQILVVKLPDAGPAKSLAEVFNQPLPGLEEDALEQAGQGPDMASGAPALQPEEAFAYEAIGYSPQTILVRLTAQPGYYLYRDKLAFRVKGAEGFAVQQVDLPKGKIKDDPEFGQVEVYYGQVEIPVQLSRPAGEERSLILEADYQGCRDGDICYPPQSSSVELTLPASTENIAPSKQGEPAAAKTAVPVNVNVSEQDLLAGMLLENPAGALLAFFVAGILLAFTPCVFPMVPILSGIIAGQGEKMTTARAFWLSLVYVLAMAVTYTVAGVLAGMFGQNLQALFQNPWILSFFIAIFIALALSMFGFFELQLPASLQTRLTQTSSQQKGGSLTGVAIMGFLSALIVGPCVAPPLAAALIVIGASGDAVLGGAALFVLSIGMGLPLILFGVSAGKLVPKAGPWMDAIKAVFGIGLLALAIWMLERIVQGPVILLLWGMLAIASAVYLGALERIPEAASGWRSLWKSLGLVLLLIGAIEIIGAASGGNDWTKPLKNLRSAGPGVDVEHVAFEKIKSLDDLQLAVAKANQAGKPAMLDFYADWCVECIRMERNTFSDPKIQALFKKIQPLQADVTPNDEIDQALMAKYGVIGPPAILFFDRQGNELKANRLVGYFEVEEFSKHLENVLVNP